MEEMDFHGMKRKKLQALCKKHGIPANLKNKEMADRLSLIFKGKEVEDPVGGSGNATGTKKNTVSNVEIIDLGSPSPRLEERSDFSSKICENSEVERLEFELNLSPKITMEGFEICGVKEDMKSGLSQGGLDSTSDEVTLEEFDNNLTEGDVEKLGDQANLLEDVCRTGVDGAEIQKQEENVNNPEGSETEKQEDNNVNNPEGSDTEKQEDNNANNLEEPNRNDLNLFLVSPVEFGYCLVEGEVQKSDHRVCVDDAAHNVENGRCDVDSMCLDSSTGTVDIDGKTDVAVEDEVHSSSEVNSTQLDILEMVVTGTATRNAETFEARFVSSPKMSVSPASERMIGLSPELLNNSESKPLQPVTNTSPEALEADNEVCDVKENIHIDLNKDQVGGSQEVVREAPYVIAISGEDLEQVRSEEFEDHSMDREVEKMSDKTNVLEDVCEYGKGRDEAAEQGDHNSPQGSIMKNLNVLHVSQDESGYPLVEDNAYNGGVYTSGSEAASKDIDVLNNLTTEHFTDDAPSTFMYSDDALDHFLRTSLNEVNCSGLDIHQDTCEEELKSPQKTGSIADPGECTVFSPNMTTVEQFIDEVRSSTFEDSDGTPVQFLPNDALVEVKSNLSICEMDVPDIGNEDMPEAKFVSSSKKSLSPTSERMIGSCPKQLNNSETKVLQSETNFFPETSRVVDIGICDVEENMLIDVNKELVDDNQQVIHAVSSVTVSNNDDLVQVASVEVGENLLEGGVGILLKNLESSLPSATKGFPAESYFDQRTLGDVVATCNVQNDQMGKEYSEEVLHMANELVLLQTSTEESNLVNGELTRLFENSDVHEDADLTEAEDKNQHYIKEDMDSTEKPDEYDYAPTMHQCGEMKSCTFNLQQISASGTVTGDEGTFQEKLETPPKFTPIASLDDSISFYPKPLESSMKNELKIVKSLPVKRARDVLGTSVLKENMKIAKKEQVGTVISKSAFPKRKPLQDLQQN